MILHNQEKLLLRELAGKGRTDIRKIAMNTDSARRAASWLEEKGLAKIMEKTTESFTKSEECREYLEKGFPEVEILKKGGAAVSTLSGGEKIGMVWAKKKGWVGIVGGKIKVLGGPDKKEGYRLEKAARNPESASPKELEELKKRKLVSVESSREFTVELTKKGEEETAKAGEIKEEIGELTHQIIAGGSWKNAEFRPYAIAPTQDAPLGKMHPLSRMVKKVKRVFRDMGFEEMEGGIVESSFWNFDALFQPQDHPARELADTFYVEGEELLPGEEEIVVEGSGRLPEPGLVRKVRESHEKGWKYQWDPKEARKRVLRTHTTALSARKLHAMEKNGGVAGKYFSVGRVFRNEATDFKHLAEFHQVEGIVAWEGATFRDLLGLLGEFYRRMGFEKLRFRPSYFPYTEPSLEIDVYLESRKEWMELGGAGVFRPETTKPICGMYPVLAWGLSLERPMMLLEGLEDMRTFYRNDLEWLRGYSIQNEK